MSFEIGDARFLDVPIGMDHVEVGTQHHDLRVLESVFDQVKFLKRIRKSERLVENQLNALEAEVSRFVCEFRGRVSPDVVGPDPEFNH